MKQQTVPKLSLAPKRRKPLSLWNPFDYFQLLYWAFFFPQALIWYVETLGEEKGLSDEKSWAEQYRWWQNSSIQRSLWIQGLSSATLFTIIVAYFLNTLGVALDVVYGSAGGFCGILMGLMLGFKLGTVKGIAASVSGLTTFSIVGGVTEGIAETISKSITTSVTGDAVLAGFLGGLTFGSTEGLLFGIAFGIVISVATELRAQRNLIKALTRLVLLIAISCIIGGVVFGVVFRLIGSNMFGIVRSAVGDVALGFTGGIAFGIARRIALGFGLGIGLGIMALRPEVWLSDTISRWIPKYRQKNFGHTTTVSLPGLTKQLTDWLHLDWMQAIQNINEILAYTSQFSPVVHAVNQSLSTTQNDILLLRVSQLSENLSDWDILKYSSASLFNDVEEGLIDSLFILPRSIKQHLKASINTQMRIDTPARAAAAGFWYLYKNHPDKAAQAFAQIQYLPHGQEMQKLAECIVLAINVENLDDSSLTISLSIPDSPLLRENTWPAISRLRSVVDDAQIISQSYSRSAKSLALNRSLGKLTEIVDKAHLIPLAERDLIVSIAKDWREKLLSNSAEIGEATHTQPVPNPYVAGDPVEGPLFVGRSEVIKQLEELLLMGNQLQSVVLYGHRRMGKTSILKNLSTYLGNNIQVVYINLLNLGSVSQGAGEVLITLTDAISNQLSITPPNDEALLTLSYPTFRRFIQTINQTLKANQGLIIALDEFEKIEELILASKLDADFLGFLRGLLQMSPKIAFAFAGLHTLEEMTEDYFNPLFASVLPIRIGFFTLPETRELLANPTEDFTLDYRPETLDEIYRLTAGQPYLTQLIGFQLVRHYNHQVFEQGTERAPIFTPEDLNTVIHHSDFFTKGRYYFTGVWNQAAQDAPGQQELLKLLAEKEEGRTISNLRRKSTLSETKISEALKLLERHDVVAQHEGNWKIIVPLFRQWVLQHQ